MKNITKNINKEDLIKAAKEVAVGTLTVTCKTVSFFCNSLLDFIKESREDKKDKE